MDIWTGQELNFGSSENDFNYSLLEGIVRLSVCLSMCLLSTDRIVWYSLGVFWTQFSGAFKVDSLESRGYSLSTDSVHTYVHLPTCASMC